MRLWVFFTPVSRWLAGEAGAAFRQRHWLVCEILAEDMGFDLLRVVDDRTVEVRRVHRRIEAIRQLRSSPTSASKRASITARWLHL
jgi:hypothetical protein